MDAKDKLIEHYSNKSKHSNYQVLPTVLRELVGVSDIQTRTRHEEERLEYILNNVSTEGKTIIDIGGNTGYFVFELLDAGAKSVCLYEGNAEHAKFVELARNALGVNKERLEVISGYFPFSDVTETGNYDIGVLLNVLHHIGDDYGDSSLSIEHAKVEILKQLRFMRKKVNTLVFQLGFCWQGNPSSLLFENGTKKEMIDYIQEGVKGTWRVKAIGIAEKNSEGIKYNDLNNENIERDDSLGEFLNRPLFILEAE